MDETIFQEVKYIGCTIISIACLIIAGLSAILGLFGLIEYTDSRDKYETLCAGKSANWLTFEESKYCEEEYKKRNP